MGRLIRLVAGLSLAAATMVLLVGCSGSETTSAESGAETTQMPASETQSSETPASTIGFSERFAGYQAAPEPNGDLGTVVWPDYVVEAGAEVQRLYEFQVANGDLMRYMPCYCGCNAEAGHRSNRDCYIKKVNADGTVVFDSMAPT